MYTATGLNVVSKCKHFDPYTSQGYTSESQQHKALVLALIKRHTALLLDNLADLLNDHGTKDVTHHHWVWEKKKQIIRFKEDQYLIPKSARINSRFHVSQEAEQSEKFSTLKEETDRIITNFWKALKEQD